ncbi:hypothetical protein [Rhodoferax sp. PAMC 29310]|uniref:hypothetical protein n=1 Tax=Rhodoferax sp. PAMC 29310 TaxID=2822760 RepID=UPI001B33D6AD|nr:hypothetical protein [Rhodoferax sp. PAMC 29310]
MKFKTFALAAVTALTTFATGAQAATTDITPVSGSLSGISLGTLTLFTTSHIVGGVGSRFGSFGIAI